MEVPSVSAEGGVSVDEIRPAWDKIALLHEESQQLTEVDESLGAKRAEFLGQKMLEILDGLLEEES